jgi:hypothetical protein
MVACRLRAGMFLECCCLALGRSYWPAPATGRLTATPGASIGINSTFDSLAALGLIAPVPDHLPQLFRLTDLGGESSMTSR